MEKRDNKKEKAPKIRLDALLVERGFFPSREKAQAHIMAGEVLVDGQVSTRAGVKVPGDAAVEVLGGDRFASRGGEKLDGALDAFGLDVSGLHALDVGASTGGFTDCLLQRGASSVTALDVGRGQLAARLSGDPRVTVRDRTNARNLSPEDFPQRFGIITIDVSFISLEKVLPALAPLLAAGGMIVALVKPQFEAGPKSVGRGGVVKDPAVHTDVLRRAAAAASALGLTPCAATYSPIKGPAGNIEFFLLLRGGPRRDEKILTEQDFEPLVTEAHRVLGMKAT